MNQKKKVVLDTNVFIHGWFAGNPECEKILDMLKKRKFYLAFSQDTIGELIYITKNFARHALDDTTEQVNLLADVSELYYYASSVNTKDIKVAEINDPSDLMFVKCAVGAKVDYLVSNDIDSGMHKLEEYKFKVVNSAEFIRIMEQQYDN